MADPTARGTLGFEFEFFPTALKQLTADQVQRAGLSSTISGHETIEQLKERYPGCLVVAAGTPYGKEVYIGQELVEYLRQQGFHANDMDQQMIPRLPQDPELRQQRTPFVENVINEQYHRWSITGDITVSHQGTFNPQGPNQDPYLISEMKNSSGVEVISPAITDTPEAYQEVVNVLNKVKNLYFLHINETCGLHVHVAFGKHQITMAPLRKIASLLFTIDPFLVTLHPEYRAEDDISCPSIRKLSNVARGWRFADAVRDLNRNRVGEDDEFTPLYWQSVHKAGGSLAYVPIPEAVEEIKACKKPEEIAWLLQCELRANYNFRAFLDMLNPTIEFREHAMTGDAARVVAWGRFCVALVRYAAFDMSDDDLEEIVMTCNDAETEPENSRSSTLWELLDFMNLQDNAFDLRVPRPRPRNQSHASYHAQPPGR
ncbi:hypothetical protein PG995_013176 [Apiospora arundinis]